MSIAHDSDVLTTAPLDNDGGFALALKHLVREAAAPRAWRTRYDRISDSLTLQHCSPRPSISYYYPDDPRLLFRLDEVTGELTAIEFTSFRRYFVKEYPRFKGVLPPPWFVARILRALGLETKRVNMTVRDVLRLIIDRQERNRAYRPADMYP